MCVRSARGLKNILRLSGSAPIFAKIFLNGNAEKKQRLVPDFVFGGRSAYRIGHCHTLALVDAHFAFCVHVFCAGNGHYITADEWDFRLIKRIAFDLRYCRLLRRLFYSVFLLRIW